MTESDWLRSEDLFEMMDVLEDRFQLPSRDESAASDRKVASCSPYLLRKLRLFSCACCYRIWHLLIDERIRRVVLASERFADGEIGRKKMSESWSHALEALLDSTGSDNNSGFFAFLALFRLPTSPTLAAVWAGWEPDAARTAFETILNDPSREFSLNWGAMPRLQRAFYLHRASVCSPLQAATETARVTASCLEGQGEGAVQAGLLREILGNPYRRVEISRDWVTWSDRTVYKLARSIYKERTFEDMPILADALEDAGCNHREMLAHCRGKGTHVRGCWVLDALMGRGVD